ncbi:MAG: glycine--tRNA ligase subunit beta [Rhodobacteraceae bacterium]|nr:glycine--tRNA ligase subunit beta [Paracoccaceae bacterium]
MPDLLIELFSEEIPARLQKDASATLERKVTDELFEAGLIYESSEHYSTPRRLTLHVKGLLAESPTTVEERKGPKVGAPDKALEGFLRGAGVSKDDLEIRDDKKGQVYFAQITKAGRPAPAIIAEVLEKTIRTFPWPKSMRWGAGSLKWVRPLQSILCVLDGAVVPVTVDQFEAGAETGGHRFMAPTRFTVRDFADYEAQLRGAHVILRPAERQEMIWTDAVKQAEAAGLEVVEDRGLLAEVAGLVEWPVVLMGDIGEDFLALPPEVLQTSMKEHQKFFSVRNAATGRIEKFITVANRETADDGATILAGNQKVLAARLSDAKFFWENDLREAKAGMGAWTGALENVTFHAKLGTQAERIARIAALAKELAPIVGADPAQAEEAARIAKADLASEMVYEFPELQGIMGRYYALEAGHAPDVANAARDHYAPLGPSDDVPTEPVSVAVSLAEKLDILTGFWAIDEKPTGSKDPYALRRAALGVIRLLLDNDTRLSLNDRFDGEWSENLLYFFHDRLKVYLRDRGIRHDVIDACLAMAGDDDLTLLVKRATALQEVMNTEDGTNLVQGFKRANNLLSQAEEKDGVEYSYGADMKFAEAEEEKALFAALETAEGKIAPAMGSEDFVTAMAAMAELRAPIDAFFEAVKINADSEVVRRNRLNLLSQIRTTVGQVADLTKVEG